MPPEDSGKSDSPIIRRIEPTAFTVQIKNIATDPSHLGVFYEPGPGMPQPRFAVRVFTDTGGKGRKGGRP
jgi:hypothetical protein